MKIFFERTLVALAGISIILSGCETTKKANNTQKGAVIGAAGGAVIGGIIGNNTGSKGNSALGVLIGSVVGGVAGGVIGNKMDRQAEKIKTEIPGAQVERVGEGIDVTFSENNPDGSKAGVYFATNKSDINANSKLALDKMVKIFAEYPETNILVAGHTDDVGTDEYNMNLSKQRAEAVGNYLKAAGVASSRFTIAWFGETQPKVPNTDDASRAQNRRVQFAITANEKMKADAQKEAESK